MSNILRYHEVTPEILGCSEKGQDSFLQYTFEKIGVTNKYYVEFGASDGVEACNTFHLRKNKGWDGLLLEGNSKYSKNAEINLHIRRITKDNICDLFKEFKVPQQFDFLCIDMDGFEYWVTKSILEGNYSPRVIMIENNVRFEPYESKTLKYNPEWRWDGKKWCGASPYAYKKLFNAHEYVPVWIHFDDMFAIRRDVLESHGYGEPDWSYVYPKSNALLYGPPTVPSLNEWQEV